MSYSDWEPVIGLEIHAQLLTDSKVFSPDSAHFGGNDNEYTDPVSLGMPGAAKLEPRQGAIQSWTAHCEALLTPDLDECLDDEPYKREFWRAFKRLGDWHGDLPPY